MGKDLGNLLSTRRSPSISGGCQPAFGRPHHVTDIVATADASRIVVAGSVYDELEGLPRPPCTRCGTAGCTR